VDTSSRELVARLDRDADAAVTDGRNASARSSDPFTYTSLQ
jgi:hypothetical protein